MLKQFGMRQDTAAAAVKRVLQLYGGHSAGNADKVNYTELCDAVYAGPFFIWTLQMKKGVVIRIYTIAICIRDLQSKKTDSKC